MKRRLLISLMSAALIAAAVPAAAPDGSAAETGIVAFPGAEGAGRYATGGRGGTVYHVTNLNDSGEGSLRDAVSKSNRIVVFDVGGTIELKSDIDCKSNITIAGQTAPGGSGVTLKNGKFGMGGDNIIVRYISSRPGERGEGSGDYDAWGGSAGSNSIIDHCSIGWANDEQFGLYSNNMNQTVQYTIIGPANCVSYHSKGAHGFGAMFGKGQNSWHHNLICHNISRNFRGKVEKTNTMDFVNNVVYNWGRQTAYGTFGRINFINNYYKAGPSTTGSHRYISISSGTAPENYKFVLTGNTMRSADDSVYSETMDNNNWNGGIDYGNAGLTESDYRSDTLFKVSDVNGTDSSAAISAESAEQAYANVLSYVGAAVDAGSRTRIDAQVVEETRTGTGSLTGGRDFSTVTDSDVLSAIETHGITYIDYDSYYPEPVLTKEITDSDNDGMPDEWELARGLDPNDASDATGDYLDRGYNNIEYYINDLTVDSFPEGVVEQSPVLTDLGEDYTNAVEDADAIRLHPTNIISPGQLTLPVTGSLHASDIEWSSGSSAIVIKNNVITAVNRPASVNEKVTLTAKITSGEFTVTRTYIITVRATSCSWTASESDKGKTAGAKLMNDLYTVSDLSAGGAKETSVNGISFSYYVSGDTGGGWSSGSATGTALRYTASENGYLTAYITDLGSNKTAYIRAENGAEEDAVSVYGGSGSGRMLTSYVKSGETYYIYVAGSKGRFLGVTFDVNAPTEMWYASADAAAGTELTDGLAPCEDMTYTESAKTIDGVGFTGCIKGTVNPSANGSQGASLAYTPPADCTVKVYYKIGAGKTFKINDAAGNIVAEFKNEGDASELAATEAELKAGVTYYIYIAGSKAEFYGMGITKTYGSEPEPTDEPTQTPTEEPTQTPTEEPTEKPSEETGISWTINGEAAELLTNGTLEVRGTGADDASAAYLAVYGADGRLSGLAAAKIDGGAFELGAEITENAAAVKVMLWDGTTPKADTVQIKRQ